MTVTAPVPPVAGHTEADAPLAVEATDVTLAYQQRPALWTWISRSLAACSWPSWAPTARARRPCCEPSSGCSGRPPGACASWDVPIASNAGWWPMYRSAAAWTGTFRPRRSTSSPWAPTGAWAGSAARRRPARAIGGRPAPGWDGGLRGPADQPAFRRSTAARVPRARAGARRRGLPDGRTLPGVEATTERAIVILLRTLRPRARPWWRCITTCRP